MSRGTSADMAMAVAMLGMQPGGSAAGAFAVAYIMYTLAPWHAPQGRDLERAHAAAARYNVSDDLARFMPPEPARFAGRRRKDAYRGVLIALKQIDALEGDERVRVIAEMRTLLGALKA